jgi:hypothetical protein
MKGLTETPEFNLVHWTLIFGGTPKNNVFLGYFPEQDRHLDEI